MEVAVEMPRWWGGRVAAAPAAHGVRQGWIPGGVKASCCRLDCRGRLKNDDDAILLDTPCACVDVRVSVRYWVDRRFTCMQQTRGHPARSQQAARLLDLGLSASAKRASLDDFRNDDFFFHSSCKSGRPALRSSHLEASVDRWISRWVDWAAASPKLAILAWVRGSWRSPRSNRHRSRTRIGDAPCCFLCACASMECECKEPPCRH